MNPIPGLKPCPVKIYALIVHGRFSRFRVFTSATDAKKFRRDMINLWHDDKRFSEEFRKARVETFERKKKMYGRKPKRRN